MLFSHEQGVYRESQRPSYLSIWVVRSWHPWHCFVQISWAPFQTFRYPDKNVLRELKVELWILPGTCEMSKLAPLFMLENVVEVDCHSFFISDSSQENISLNPSHRCFRRVQLQITAYITEWGWIQFVIVYSFDLHFSFRVIYLADLHH